MAINDLARRNYGQAFSSWIKAVVPKVLSLNRWNQRSIMACSSEIRRNWY